MKMNRQDLIGKKVTDFLDEENTSILMEQMQLRLKGEKRPYEGYFTRLDGTKVPCIINCTPLFDDEGLGIGSFAMITDITERKHVEDVLKRSEEKYRSFVQNFQGIAFRGRLDSFTPLFFHGAVEKITGYTESDFIAGKPRWDQVIHPDDIARINKDLDILRTNPNITIEREYRIIRKDGGIQWVYEIVQHVLDGSEKPIYAQGSIYDITERKKTEKALLESERKYKDLQDISIDGHAWTDMEGHLIEVNESYKNMMGYSEDELRNLTYIDITPDKWHASEQLILAEQILVKGYSDPYEKELIRKDGTIFPVELRAYLIKDAQGNNKGMRAVVRDITERKKAEKSLQDAHSKLENRVQKRTEELAKKNIDLMNEIELRKQAEGTLLESEERFRAVAYCTADFIWEGDVRTNSMNWSGDIDSCLGYKEGEFPRTISGHMDNIHHEDKDKLLKAHEQALATGKDFHASYRIKCKDGSYRYWDARGKAIGFEGGKAITWVGSVTDFTDKVLLEEEAKLSQSRLILANKMTSLGTIASGVAHEINNPNSYIMSNAQVLFKIWKDADKIIQDRYDKDNTLHVGGIPFPKLTHLAPKLILGISEGSSRINQIIDNLRNFSRPVNINLDEKVNVNNAILTSTAMIESYIQKHTNKFQVHCDDDIPFIKGNSQQLEQVIINLTINALQALKDKTGKVSISTSFDMKTNSIVIRITDDGEGIDASLIKQIKEPFFTTKQDKGGTGLGLSIASTIVKDHKGSMDFISEAGKGTTVLVSLPVYS